MAHVALQQPSFWTASATPFAATTHCLQPAFRTIATTYHCHCSIPQLLDATFPGCCLPNPFKLLLCAAAAPCCHLPASRTHSDTCRGLPTLGTEFADVGQGRTAFEAELGLVTPRGCGTRALCATTDGGGRGEIGCALWVGSLQACFQRRLQKGMMAVGKTVGWQVASGATHADV